jgi:hypothetical protein
MTALKEVVFIGNAAKEEELKQKEWRFSLLFKSKDSPPLSLTVSCISSFWPPQGAGNVHALGCASDSGVALGMARGIYLADISSGVSEKIRNDVGEVCTVLRLNDSLVLFGYDDGYTIYKTQPLLSSLFKNSNTGAGTCTSGCVIHVSSAIDTPFIILAFNNRLSVVNTQGIRLLDERTNLEGGWPQVRALLHNVFVGLENTIDGSSSILVLRFDNEGHAAGIESLSSWSPSRKVMQIECCSIKSRASVLHAGDEEIGVLTFSESSQQLIPQSRIYVSDHKLRAMANFFISDNFLVLFTYAANSNQLNQFIYDVSEGKLSKAKSVEDQRLRGSYRCYDKQIIVSKKNNNKIELIVNSGDRLRGDNQLVRVCLKI